MEPPLYKAQVACQICAITPRMLDYWVTTGMVAPRKTYRVKGGKRDIFLFAFEELVQLRIIRSLRNAGISLQNVRIAIDELKKRSGKKWQTAWIVTDGKKVYFAHDSQRLEEACPRNGGQFAFAVMALADAKGDVNRALNQNRIVPFRSPRKDGNVTPFARLGEGMVSRGLG
jgi:DNA-binding transcriptional MerR regulator